MLSMMVFGLKLVGEVSYGMNLVLVLMLILVVVFVFIFIDFVFFV